jgi:hypothetical protein
MNKTFLYILSKENYNCMESENAPIQGKTFYLLKQSVSQSINSFLSLLNILRFNIALKFIFLKK